MNDVVGGGGVADLDGIIDSLGPYMLDSSDGGRAKTPNCLLLLRVHQIHEVHHPDQIAQNN